MTYAAHLGRQTPARTTALNNMATLPAPDGARSAARQSGGNFGGNTLRLFIAAAALAATTAMAAPAAAQSFTQPQLTASAGYTRFADGSEDWDGHSATIRAGARVHRYFGVEAEGSLGLGSSDIDGVDIGMNHTIAAFAVAYWPVSENTDVYVRAGFGTTEFEVEFAGMSVTDSYSGPAIGIGGQHFFDGKNGVRMDVTRHEYDELDGGFDAVSFAYVRRF